MDRVTYQNGPVTVVCDKDGFKSVAVTIKDPNKIGYAANGALYMSYLEKEEAIKFAAYLSELIDCIIDTIRNAEELNNANK